MTVLEPIVGDPPDGPFSVWPFEGGTVFVIERPGKLNALTRACLEGLAACLDRLEAEGGRLLIVTGRGDRAFCAGTDLAELQAMEFEAQMAKNAMARALFARLSRSNVLSAAAINGMALGGGLELAMACTLRVCAPHAVLSLPEIKLGLLPAYGGTQFLPTLVGPARALDLMLTGRSVAASEALAIGLVDRVAQQDHGSLSEAVALGREIARYSATAVKAIRRCVEAAGPEVTDRGLAVEDSYVRAVFDDTDAREGVAAFLEKRPARFGRSSAPPASGDAS